MLQLALQQYSSRPQTVSPHGLSLGGHSSFVQPRPSFAQRLQLSLQQYFPGPQVVSLQGWAHNASLQSTSGGMQSPPQCEQKTLLPRHRRQPRLPDFVLPFRGRASVVCGSASAASNAAPRRLAWRRLARVASSRESQSNGDTAPPFLSQSHVAVARAHRR